MPMKCYKLWENWVSDLNPIDTVSLTGQGRGRKEEVLDRLPSAEIDPKR